MLLTKVSQMSGKIHTMDLPITQEQLNRYAMRRELVQDIFPDLTPGQREFIMTGIIEEEWEDMFGSMNKEDEEAL